MIPESTFARIYQEVINFCKTNGAFDPATMGTVPNVGLMAQQAEEYGSHDKTFEIPEDGVARIVDIATGEVLLAQNVEAGDIWRMCQAKDAADPRLGQAGGDARPQLRHAGRVLAGPVSPARGRADQEGRDLPEGPRHRPAWTSRSCRRCAPCATRWSASIRGLDTISVTGNILRDYLTDLFPIMELGTSAKMLSIVPLMAGGGLFETGAGGSAPKHVQQFVEENHLRWDSLGEFLALAVSLEDLGIKTGNEQGQAAGQDAGRGQRQVARQRQDRRRRKTGELDNRGSHFYLALYWAQALAAQTEDAELQAQFAPLAEALAENEEKIVAEADRGAGQAGRHRRLLPGRRREVQGSDASERDVQRRAGCCARVVNSTRT